MAKPIEPEVLPPAERVRAHRIKAQLKAGETPTEDDLAWIRDYESRKGQSRGASRSHKVSYTEESAEAAAEGDALAVATAMAAPQLAKEEGRRLDNLINAATKAQQTATDQIKTAFEMVLKMAAAVLDRNGQLEKVHLGMLTTIGDTMKATARAEAELITSQAEAEAQRAIDEAAESPNGVDGMIKELMPIIIQEIGKRAGAARGVPPKG